jgi:hypothetical protein
MFFSKIVNLFTNILSLQSLLLFLVSCWLFDILMRTGEMFFPYKQTLFKTPKKTYELLLGPCLCSEVSALAWLSQVEAAVPK